MNLEKFPFKSRFLQSENDCKVMSVVDESRLVSALCVSSNNYLRDKSHI